MDELRKYIKRKLGISDEEYNKLVEQEKKNSKIVQVMEQLKTPDDKYKEIEANPDTTLEELKKAKMEQLDYLCSVNIVKGFDFTINGESKHFSLSLVAQSNMQETGAMFRDGITTSEKWTVVDNATGKTERVDLDEATFNDVRNAGRVVVRDSVSKLRDTLEPQVHAATTVDEVKAITWQ